MVDFITAEQVAVIERLARLMLYMLGGFAIGLAMLWTWHNIMSELSRRKKRYKCDGCGAVVHIWTVTAVGNLCHKCWEELEDR